MPKKFESDDARRAYNRKAMARWRANNPDKVAAGAADAALRTAEWRASLTPEELAASRAQTAKWRADFKARDPEGYRNYCRLSGKAYRFRLRGRVLEAYGGKCACCGETAREFLTFDHMDGGGNKHRRENGLNGAAFYLWLWNEGNLQPRIRILCFNCNCSIGFVGYCPHQRVDIRSQNAEISEGSNQAVTEHPPG